MEEKNTIKLSTIKCNPNNPRIIKDEKYQKLINSIKEFPKMMELRPMVINNDNIVLGGNMRLKALKELGYKDISDNWVKKASELTEDEQKRFIIADNVGFGEHNWEILKSEWDIEELKEWGLEIPDFDIESDDKIINEDKDSDLMKIIVHVDSEFCLELMEEIKKLDNITNIEIGE